MKKHIKWQPLILEWHDCTSVKPSAETQCDADEDVVILSGSSMLSSNAFVNDESWTWDEGAAALSNFC
jgi:hypothetical protein